MTVAALADTLIDDQPPLPLAYAARLGVADFCISDANRAAVLWLARPQDWPMSRCLLLGPPASGKSHLAGIFAADSGGVVIENADLVADGEPLFHAWNAATYSRPLLLTAQRRPKFWAHSLADLASRLAATPQVALADPDDALMLAVLRKRFADRGLRVSEDVIAYLALRMERSFAAVDAVVAQLDALSLGLRRDITVPLAREVLEGQLTLAV